MLLRYPTAGSFFKPAPRWQCVHQIGAVIRILLDTSRLALEPAIPEDGVLGNALPGDLLEEAVGPAGHGALLVELRDQERDPGGVRVLPEAGSEPEDLELDPHAGLLAREQIEEELLKGRVVSRNASRQDGEALGAWKKMQKALERFGEIEVLLEARRSLAESILDKE